MIISFAWTMPALLAGRKTVTRRRWKDRHLANWQRAWDQRRYIHDAYDYLPRARNRNGRKVATIRLTCRPYVEALADMPESDLEAEGGYWRDLADFIDDEPLTTKYAVVRFELVGICIDDDELANRLAADRWMLAEANRPRSIAEVVDALAGRDPGVAEQLRRLDGKPDNPLSLAACTGFLEFHAALETGTAPELSHGFGDLCAHWALPDGRSVTVWFAGHNYAVAAAVNADGKRLDLYGDRPDTERRPLMRILASQGLLSFSPNPLPEPR